MMTRVVANEFKIILVVLVFFGLYFYILFFPPLSYIYKDGQAVNEVLKEESRRKYKKN